MSFKLLEIGMDALRRARIGRAALVTAALCVATAPSPSYADKTISENLTLTEDTDWSGEGTVTIADGATLDFTQWTGAFPVTSPAISYASGANIALKLEPATTGITALARSKDAETGKRNGYLLSWDAIPAGVTFSPDAATRARFRVVPETNGLRVSFKGGFCIIIK